MCWLNVDAWKATCDGKVHADEVYNERTSVIELWWSRWSPLASASKWMVPLFVPEVQCSGSRTYFRSDIASGVRRSAARSSRSALQCSVVAYPCGWRGVELWRFGAKQWWAESRVTRSTRWQEYLFSSASPGLVIWLGITWKHRDFRTRRLEGTWISPRHTGCIPFKKIRLQNKEAPETAVSHLRRPYSWSAIEEN